MTHETERDMTQPDLTHGPEPLAFAALDSALSEALRPPPTPGELRAGVLAAIAREAPVDIEARRRELTQEYAAAVAQLNRQYLRRCRDALLLGASLLTAADLSIEPLSRGLAPFFADSAPLIAGCVVLALGALCGGALLRELSRIPGTLNFAPRRD
jgi:hypothetical protein